MGERQPINIESLTIKEIKKFFKESEKIAYEDVLVSVFKDFTDGKSCELNGNRLIGRIENKENSPVMVLTNLRGARKLRLQVFRKERDFNRSSGSGDLVVFAGPAINGLGLEIIETIAFDLKSDTYLLSDKYNRFLIEVLEKVRSRFKKAKSGK